MKNYKQMFNKRYLAIYIVYFCVFFSLGSLDTLIPLDLEEDFSSRTYGMFLTIMSFTEIFLPTCASFLSNKFGARKVTIYYFSLAIICAFFMEITNNSNVFVVFLIIICCSRTIFNFSVGNEIIFHVEDSKKGKFFAVRDMFLFSGISLGLFIAGIMTKYIKIRSVLILFSAFLFVPTIIMCLFGKQILYKVGNGNFTDERKSMNEYLRMLKKLFRKREFVVLLLIGILTSVYSSCQAFLPFLASKIGLNYQEILSSFAAITIINVIIALFIGDFSDNNEKKYLYLIDLGSDLVPVIIFAFTNNVILFYIAIFLSSLKDIFAPTSFAYKYELFGKYEDELSRTGIGILESVTNLVSFFMPTVIGFLWGYIDAGIFCIAAFCIILSVLVGFALPRTTELKTNE